MAKTTLSVASVLRAARAEKGYSLDDIAAQTNISLYILKAFESGAKPKIAAIYTRGYLRTLAQLLDLDASALVALYDDDHAQQQKAAQDSQQQQLSEEPSSTDRSDTSPAYAAPVGDALHTVVDWSRSFQANVRSAGANFWRTGALAAIPMVCLCVLAFAYHAIQDEINGAKPALAQEVTGSADPMGVLASEALIHSENTRASQVLGGYEQETEQLADASPVLMADEWINPALTSQVASRSLSDQASNLIDSASNTSSSTDEANSAESSVVPSTPPNRMFAASINEAPGAAKMVNLHRAQDRLVIDVLEDSWIDVRDSDGNPLYRNLARAGHRIDVSGELPFALHVGNVPGLALELNGEPVAISRVRRDNSARLTLASN